MDKRYIAVGAVTIVVLGLAYVIYSNSGDNHMGIEPALVGLDGQAEDAPFHPSNVVPGQQQIYLPHRYPGISGANISCVIHNGFDSLRVPARQDTKWIEGSPAEVQWLWQNQRTSAVTGMLALARTIRRIAVAVMLAGGSWEFSPVS